jgi:hypothetical protein
MGTPERTDSLSWAIAHVERFPQGVVAKRDEANLV